MKILMRADTHVSFSVPAEEPKAKCTNAQANTWRDVPETKILFELFLTDPGSPISIDGIDGSRLLVGLHIPGPGDDAESDRLQCLGTRSEYTLRISGIFPASPSPLPPSRPI